ncbi:MAG: hypothetical protein K5880_14345 [Hydrogenophaga sp.]|uniref:hypothetical protein n=1 Tax=Hydrogenophaga sp. TaxID=1904254 RepID=UPI002632666F|nr:hypothetical protein [Hydrogenophaga sp.]MCV0439804.1 hypothetical protein [Hydrogenophaga sp.]
MSLHDIWRGDVMPLSGVAVSIGRNTFDPPAPVVPVVDIHARQLDLHDSALDASGILSYNARQTTQGGRLELIPSMSGAQPIVTAILFEAYDTTGGNTITTTIGTVALDTERTNTHPDIFVFDNTNDEVQINQAGTYAIEYRVGLDVSSGTRTSSRAQLERQAAGGAFAEVAGARSFGYHRTTSQGEDTLMCKVIMDIDRGDTVRIRGIVLAGANLTQLADSTGITIRKLS